MSNMKRHVGRINNTGQRIVVAFMQIPNDPEHALVIATDTLPLRYENALMTLLESNEGQTEYNFADVMGRRPMIDSTKSILQSFHESGLLMRVSIDNITMMPSANMPFPLRTVLEQMGKLGPAPAEMEKYNPFSAHANSLGEEQRLGMARNLLVEADLLIADANKKREQAYTYAPDLRPTESVVTAVETAPKPVKAQKVAPKVVAPAPKAKTPRKASVKKANV